MPALVTCQHGLLHLRHTQTAAQCSSPLARGGALSRLCCGPPDCPCACTCLSSYVYIAPLLGAHHAAGCCSNADFLILSDASTSLRKYTRAPQVQEGYFLMETHVIRMR